MDFIKPGPNKRVCAFFIDSIIGQVCIGMFSSVIEIDIGWIIWIVSILFKDFLEGQSAGKLLVGIQIIDESNLPVKYPKTILRNIFMIIPIFPIIEYFRILRDEEEGKRIGDDVAKTKVCDLKPQRQDSIFLWISILLAIVVIGIQAAMVIKFFKQHP